MLSVLGEGGDIGPIDRPPPGELHPDEVVAAGARIRALPCVCAARPPTSTKWTRESDQQA